MNKSGTYNSVVSSQLLLRIYSELYRDLISVRYFKLECLPNSKEQFDYARMEIVIQDKLTEISKSIFEYDETPWESIQECMNDCH